MAEPDDLASTRFWRAMREFALGTGLVFLVAMAVGFLDGHFERGGGALEAVPLVIFGMIVLAVILCGWLLVRQLRAPTGEEPLTRKERLNRNILVGCGILGGLTAFVLVLAVDGGAKDAGGVFSNAPLPAWVAAGLVIVLGVLLPIISVVWHRTVDEQETDAYKTGALYGFYLYMFVAPIWWLSWRGGFAPEPNGFVIYFATIFLAGIIWTWKKYR